MLNLPNSESFETDKNVNKRKYDSQKNIYDGFKIAKRDE